MLCVFMILYVMCNWCICVVLITTFFTLILIVYAYICVYSKCNALVNPNFLYVTIKCLLTYLLTYKVRPLVWVGKCQK